MSGETGPRPKTPLKMTSRAAAMFGDLASDVLATNQTRTTMILKTITLGGLAT